MTQLQFLSLLNEAASALGAREYTQSTLSKLETGAQEPSFEDIECFALVDPERRGKLWLAWSETVDGTRLERDMPDDSFQTREQVAVETAKNRKRPA